MTSRPDAGTYLVTISTILDAWAAYEGELVEEGLLATRLDAFPRLAPRAVRDFKRRLVDARWKELDGFVVGAPVTVGKPTVFPVGLLALKKTGKELELSVRVACFYMHDERPQGIAWRFEPSDPKPVSGSGKDKNRAHHFPHVQRITAWKPGAAPGLWHDDYRKAIYHDGAVDQPAATPSEVNESRPAFPLRCSNPPGLLINVIASLYGSTVADEILEAAVPPLPGWLRKEADVITGRSLAALEMQGNPE